LDALCIQPLLRPSAIAVIPVPTKQILFEENQMKTVFLSAMVMMSGMNAFAGQLVCLGNTFQATFSKNLKAVELVNLESGQEELVTTLNCSKAAKPKETFPDQLIVVATCSEPHIADAGYSAVLQSGGFAGMTTLKLGEVSFFGTTVIESLICHEEQ
jgi:hypothetical protein